MTAPTAARSTDWTTDPQILLLSQRGCIFSDDENFDLHPRQVNFNGLRFRLVYQKEDSEFQFMATEIKSDLLNAEVCEALNHTVMIFGTREASNHWASRPKATYLRYIQQVRLSSRGVFYLSFGRRQGCVVDFFDPAQYRFLSPTVSIHNIL